MDKTIKCVECNAEFVFTTGEQEFYKAQGFTSEPRRCPDCRKKRNPQGGARAPRGSESSVPSSDGMNQRPARQMYSAVCASCGKETQVPFQPTNGRPVYCSECYRSNGGGASKGSSRPSSGGRSERSSQRYSSSYTPSSSSYTDYFDDFSQPAPSRSRKRDRRDKDRGDRDNGKWS